MARKAVTDAVRARQTAGWTTVPVFYPNEQFKPPAGFTPFVLVEFPVALSERLAIADDGTDREIGTVRFVVHVKAGSGLDLAMTYAEELAALFAKTDFDGIRTSTPSSPIPIGEDGAWYKISLSVPYTTFF